MDLELRIKQRLGLSHAKLLLLLRLMLLGVSVMALTIGSATAASSLFVAKAGSQSLPLSYVLVGLLSIPLYTGFAQVIDSRPRPQLFQHLLLLGILMTLVLRVLIRWKALSVYYAIFIGFYFEWAIFRIMFTSLVSDYFTALEYKRCAPLIGMAQSIGALLGGGMTVLLSAHLTTENILLFFSLLNIVAIAQVIDIQRSEKPLRGTKKQAKMGLVAELKSLPTLVKRSPIVLFLIAGTMLLTIIYSMGEFQYMSIYAEKFPDSEKLTALLGGIRGVNEVVQLLILGLCTQPLIMRLGVSRMNLIYPITTLLGFLGLAINLSLPTALFVNMNNQSFIKAINNPVHNLNYNAVPHEYVGRVRAIGDGLFYSLGVALAGAFLWICQGRISSDQITFIGIGLILAFMVVRYLQGKSYVTSLLALLNSDSVKLSDVSEGLTNLGSHYSKEVRQLLKSKERNAQINGLELAARLEKPSQVLWEVDRLVSSTDERVSQAVVKFLSSSISHPNIIRYLGSLLASEKFSLQLIALEALIASKQSLTNAEIRRIMRRTPVKTISEILEFQRQPQDYVKVNSLLKQTPIKGMASIAEPSKQPLTKQEIFKLLAAAEEVEAVVCVAATGSSDPEIKAVCSRVWQKQLDRNTQNTVIRCVRSSGNRTLIPLLEKIVGNAPGDVKREGLEALAGLAHPEDLHLAELAVKELGHSDSLVRATALKLLGVVRSPRVLNQVVGGLEHPNLAVRLQAAEALANYGKDCLPLTQPLLYSQRQEVVEAAVAAIAKVGTRRARNILYNYLKPDYSLLPRTLIWLELIPNDEYHWRALRDVIKDYHDRLIHRVMHVLASLDREGTFDSVRKILDSTTDSVERANAVETLVSLKNRRFVVPIVSLLEQPELEPEPQTKTSKSIIKVQLPEIMSASDRWIKIAALLINSNQPVQAGLTTSPDPLVRTAVQYVNTPISDRQPEEDFFLYQVLFLKTFSLLKNLSLDELLLVQKALKLQSCADGEQICAAGSPGKQLYIVYKGTFSLRESDTELNTEPQQLMVGEHWGETGLFGDYPFPATMVADSNDCKLLILQREDFQELVNICPRLLKCFF